MIWMRIFINILFILRNIIYDETGGISVSTMFEISYILHRKAVPPSIVDFGFVHNAIVSILYTI